MDEKKTGADGFMAKVGLYISCRKLKEMDVLSKSDPQCEVFQRVIDPNEESSATQVRFNLIGETEIL